MIRTLVLGDWDADGVVSTAEVVYAQEVVGIYPERGRFRTLYLPVSPRSIEEVLKEVPESVRNLVILDVPFTPSVGKFLEKARKRFDRIIYVDHHLSTIVRSTKLENLVDELVVGKTPTAMLVAHVIKALGGRLSPRLEAFVRATTIVEKGAERNAVERFAKLMSMVVSISRALSISKDREMWIKLVKWLSEPISFTAMPFSQQVLQSIVKRYEGFEEIVKDVVLELAPTARRIFNARFVDARGRDRGVKLTVLASRLYRVFRCTTMVLGERRSRTILATRSRDDTAYRVAMKLLEMGIASDVGGHERLSIAILKTSDVEKLVDAVRKILLQG